MVSTAVELRYQVLESELEALLIEAELIRTHQPPFNVLLKDDKTPLYILITNDRFPQVTTVRKRELQHFQPKGTILGPFPSSYKVREVLKIARRIFPWCSHPEGNRPCFYYHLGLCPGACVGTISQADYQAIIHNLILFLRGQKKVVLRNIEKELKAAVSKEEFEQAARLRDSMANITAVTQRTFTLAENPILPTLKLDRAEESVIQLRQVLTNYLQLPKTVKLNRIECYDVSNTQGTNAAVSMVVFIGGQAAKEEYKVFNIKTVPGANDYAMLQEALTRRQNHPEWGIPDLIIIDGGKGQLRAVLSVWTWLTPVISIAKEPDRLIIPIPPETSISVNEMTLEARLRKPAQRKQLRYYELSLPGNHLALNLVQQLRDEAHRFSKKQHSRRRTKALLDIE